MQHYAEIKHWIGLNKSQDLQQQQHIMLFFGIAYLRYNKLNALV